MDVFFFTGARVLGFDAEETASVGDFLAPREAALFALAAPLDPLLDPLASSVTLVVFLSSAGLLVVTLAAAACNGELWTAEEPVEIMHKMVNRDLATLTTSCSPDTQQLSVTVFILALRDTLTSASEVPSFSV